MKAVQGFMNCFAILSVLVLNAASLHAQTDEISISADRPGMSTGTDVMSKSKIQWETGIGYEHDGSNETYTLNNTLVRYGLADWAEIRVGTDWVLGDSGMGVTGLSIGTKVSLVENKGWIPAISLLANLQSPHIGTPAYCPTNLTPQAYLLFHNSLTDRFGLGYNIGVEWDGDNVRPTTFAAVCFEMAITNAVGCFVENYDYFSDNGNVYDFDLGISWQVKNNLQLDLAANMSLQQFNQYFMISGGISWLIN